MKPARIRSIVLWGGLVLAVAASIAVTETSGDDLGVVAAGAPSTLATARAVASVEDDAVLPGLPLKQLARSEWSKSEADPFRSKSWYVAPPAPPKQATLPPPKPTAPPMPFKYMGALEDTAQGGKTQVYLARGNDSFQVVVGEKFADDYQLEKIERGQIVIRYLPMAILQTLSTGWTE
jgi:hypothetical protein